MITKNYQRKIDVLIDGLATINQINLMRAYNPIYETTYQNLVAASFNNPTKKEILCLKKT